MFKIIYSEPNLDLINKFIDEILTESKKETKIRKEPFFDILETDDGYEVQIILAGINKEDIKIEVDKKIMTVSAERKINEKDKYNYKGTYFGLFEKSFTLPDDVDVDKIESELSNGILSIKIPQNIDSINKKRIIKVK